ncbi:MAG: hypothetical protein KC503_16695 [Myxococcales bacterium]|nr:hypothetical protein [Myxococcales bacterium]
MRRRAAAPLAALAAFAALLTFAGCAQRVRHARVVTVPGADGQTAYYRVVVKARGKAALRVGRFDGRPMVIYSRAAAAIEQALASTAEEAAARRAIEHAARAVARRRRARGASARARLARARRLVRAVRRDLRRLAKQPDKRARVAALRKLLEDLAALPIGRTDRGAR